MTTKQNKPAGNKLPARLLKISNEYLKSTENETQTQMGNYPTMMIMTSLPRRDIADRNYVHVSQAFSLEMNCSPLGMPFGFMPRLVLATLNHKAILTQSPCVELGATVNEMLNTMRVPVDSHYKKLLVNQWYRLFRTLFTFLQTKSIIVDDGVRVSRLLISTALGSLSETAEYSLAGGNLRYWDGSCQLSADYFNLLLDHPVPVSLNALAALRSNTFEMDLYSWLTYKIFSLNFADEKTVQISYKALQDQFNYSPETVNVAFFRIKTRDALRTISVIYPEVLKCVIEAEDGKSLIIRAGKPHLRMR
jgi:hypothetical protein